MPLRDNKGLESWVNVMMSPPFKHLYQLYQLFPCLHATGQMVAKQGTDGGLLCLLAILLLSTSATATQLVQSSSFLANTTKDRLAKGELRDPSGSSDREFLNHSNAVGYQQLEPQKLEEEDGGRPTSIHDTSDPGGILLNAISRALWWLQGTIRQPVDTRLNGSAVVWPPFTLSWKTVVASILGFLAAALANPGGGGGGPLFVPLFNLLLGYDAKTSAALSKSMVFGGTIATVCFNLQLKHPRHDKALIDFDVAVLMQPLLLLGISIGVTCNVVFPAWLVQLLLCALLFFMTYKTSTKGISTWKLETKCTQENAASVNERGPSSVAEESGAPAELRVPLLQQAPSALGKPHIRPSNQWRHVAELGSVWLAYLGLQVAKVHVSDCGGLYWLLNCAQIPVSVGVSALGASRLLAEHRRRLSGAHELGAYAAEETQWGGWLLATAPLYALASGVIGGLFGIGGAVVMGPVLLELGLLPQVTAATSSFMILFSSSMSVIEYYLLGRLPTSVALYFWSLCLVAALFGLSVVRALVVWSGKASIIVFTLAAVIGASALVILIVGGTSSYFDWRSGAYMGFSSLCSG